MLKRMVVCILFVAAAAMAWEQLEDVPDTAVVGTGTHITWGNGGVWGMFPTDYAEDPETFVGYYDPASDTWGLLSESMEYDYLHHTSLTFQWQETPLLFGIGDIYDDGEYDAYLYWYSVTQEEWDSYDIDEEEEFALGNGACIAYVPNLSWDVWSYPVPGWIYCLPGGGTEFWRYHIAAESIPDISLYGYYPGPSAVIADQTPPFQWSPSAQPTQYRIQVATDQFFMSIVIDTVLSTPAFEPHTDFANDTYYWRTATWTGGGWTWGANSHNFELQGGWEQIEDDIPHSAGTGASMAYDGDAFGNPALLVLRGGNTKDFYKYDLTTEQWIDTLEDAPVNVKAGTSIATHDPTGEWGAYPFAVFGDSDTLDFPYHYYTDTVPHWIPFDTLDEQDPLFYARFPEHIGPEASMTSGPSRMNYLVVDENHFWALEPPPVPREGGQSGGMRSVEVNAHVVSGFGGVEVEYELPAAARVRATVHDAIGRLVCAIDAGKQPAGTHRLGWTRGSKGKKLSAGAYFVVLDASEKQAKLKAVVR